MSSSQRIWYTFAFLLVAFPGLFVLFSWQQDWTSSAVGRQRPEILHQVLSPSSIDALYNDVRLHDALLSLTEAVAKTSSNLGEKYDSKQLKSFAQNLTEQVSLLRGKQPQQRRRGLLGGLRGGGGGGGDGSGGQQGGSGLLSGITGGGDGNSTGGIAGILESGVSSIGNSLVGSLATPALFLGMGIGMGTAEGLNMTSRQDCQTIASQVASSYGEKATGINEVAQNLGTGLSAQLAPSLGNITSGNGTGAMIGMAAFALAQGIGQGTATGLNLTSTQFQASNGTDLPAIAGNLGLGISQPIASNIDVQKLFSQTGASGSDIMAQLPAIAAAAGEGLGEGASDGLGLTSQKAIAKRNALVARQDPAQMNISQTVGDFSRGLSKSFLQNANLTMVMNAAAPNASGSLFGVDINGMIVPIAGGAGAGIGQGAAIGLGLQPNMAMANLPANASMNETTQLVVAEFAKELVASFLANGTASKALQNLTAGAGGVFANVQGSKVAEGIARGLLEGGINAMSSIGGFSNLLQGNYTTLQALNLPALNQTSFNDSAGGAAVAFAQGLAGEALLLIPKALANPMPFSNGSINMTAPPPMGNPFGRRDLGLLSSMLGKRQAPAPAAPTGNGSSSPPLAISGPLLGVVLQGSATAFTCSGIGGFASVGLGLMQSKTINTNTTGGGSLDNQTLAMLPQGPVGFTSQGNNFTVNIQTGSILINSLPVIPWGIFTALHILLSTLAFFFALPLYFALGAAQRLSELIGHPYNRANNQKHRNRVMLFFFFPFSVGGIALGIVGQGSARHFSTSHGILGLLALIFVLPTVPTSVLRCRQISCLPMTAFYPFKNFRTALKTEQKWIVISTVLQNIVFAFSSIAWNSGWADLRAASLCVVDAVLNVATSVGLIMFLISFQLSAMAVVGLRVYFEQRMAKAAIRAAKEANGDISEKGGLNRSGTLKTFGFNEREVTPPSSVIAVAPPFDRSQSTARLQGNEDSKIGWPTEVRKFGSEDATARQRPDRDSNPFADAVADPMTMPDYSYNEDGIPKGFANPSPYDEGPDQSLVDEFRANPFGDSDERGRSRERESERYRPSSEIDGEFFRPETVGKPPDGFNYAGDVQPSASAQTNEDQWYNGIPTPYGGNPPPTYGRPSGDVNRPPAMRSFSRPRPSGEEIRVGYGGMGNVAGYPV